MVGFIDNQFNDNHNLNILKKKTTCLIPPFMYSFACAAADISRMPSYSHFMLFIKMRYFTIENGSHFSVLLKCYILNT